MASDLLKIIMILDPPAGLPCDSIDPYCHFESGLCIMWWKFKWTLYFLFEFRDDDGLMQKCRRTSRALILGSVQSYYGFVGKWSSFPVHSRSNTDAYSLSANITLTSSNAIKLTRSFSDAVWLPDRLWFIIVDTHLCRHLFSWITLNKWRRWLALAS